jgi:hypothetical protein
MLSALKVLQWKHQERDFLKHKKMLFARENAFGNTKNANTKKK